MTPRRPGVPLASLASGLAGAWGCWAPTLTRDARRVAYVSDRRGVPELWVQDLEPPGNPSPVPLSDDPVVAVHWSPDGLWMSCAVATRGGVRTEVWVTRPDGSSARRVAGDPDHASLGPWTRSGRHLVVTLAGDGPEQPNRSLLVDPDTPAVIPLAGGALVEALDLTPDERFVLLREGPRGAQRCRLLDRSDGTAPDVLPGAGAGATTLGFVRPSPPGDAHRLVAYAVTDAGLPRRALIAAPFDADGRRDSARVVAQRPDAEIDFADADDAGRRLLVVWNVEGRSELEVIDAASGATRLVAGVPGDVVNGGVLTRNGNLAVLAVEGPTTPRRLWALDIDAGAWQPVTAAPSLPRAISVPTLERIESHDGLPLSGWLYRPAATSEPGPAMVSIHGGPESQERPTFNATHQMMAAAGLTVFAPNIRGSSGFGRTFVHADDRYGRVAAIGDVAACADWLVDEGLANPGALGVSGRSYGGYVTLMCLALFPGRFAAGIDICGMSDLLTFYRDTEPWIARAATTKYGDPERDARLLEHLSPLAQAEAIRSPLLVVHGSRDTNVPLGESRQIVAALRGLGRDVEYLQLDGEGHEYHRAASRERLLLGIAAFLNRTLCRERATLREPAGGGLISEGAGGASRE